MACRHIGETSAPQQRETRRLPPPTPRSTALEQLLPKTSADAPGAPTGDDRVNPSADAKLDPTVGACLPPSQLLLFPEVLRRPLEFTQYTSIAFGLRCKHMGARPSMGSVGDCYDNALCESFFATLECELIERRRFSNRVEAWSMYQAIVWSRRSATETRRF